MRIVLILLSIAHADNSIPSPAPGGDWRVRCSIAIRNAQAAAATEEPGFKVATVHLTKNKVRFEVSIHDHEHARFFDGKPAHYFLEVIEKKSKAPGELGADVMSPKDPQASAGLTKWTRDRWANMDVQIAEYKKVALFNRLFRPAMDECLRP